MEPRLYCPLKAALARGGGSTGYGTRFPTLRFVNGLLAHARACAALIAVMLTVLPGALAGPVLGAADDSASQTAQEPPAVVPDSAPVAPDPAPIAPDPAPAPPDSDSAPAPDSPAPSPPQQSSETQPAPTAVAPATAPTRSESVQNPKRTRARENRTLDVARDRARSRRKENARERPPSSAAVKAVSPLRGIDSDGRTGQLLATGLALLVLVLLSGAFLAFISPLVREPHLQRR